ncbi:Kazal-type serine protease inhibitor domain-containing protein [Rhizobium puerariae]|uniref:Kazal-type serine protease inhibitor domain-containing protein n=1 Tax=Rhizobium puerariae TaxID=1585791 RepID=A0ABV6ABS0_9HYPH
MVSCFGQSKRLAFFLLIPLLSGCVEGGPGPGGYYPPQRPWPEPRPQPQMCTMEYRPVCGERGGRTETFGNACQARERGYRVVSSGECRQPGFPQPGRPDRPDWDHPGRPDRPDWDRPGRPDRPDWDRPDRPGRPERPGGVCTREYRPVCGQRGSRTQTFPNACEAGNAGFSVVASGECRR